MRATKRAAVVAASVMAAVAGSAAVGIAALAREGVCLHRLGLFGLHADPAAAPGGAMAGMAGMPMPAMAMAPGAPCPIVTGAAMAAGLLYLAALVAIAIMRPRPAEIAFAAARLVLGVGFVPRTLTIAAIAAVPLGGAIVMDGTSTLTAATAAVFLGLCAALLALLAGTAARVTLAFACRLAGALLAPRWLPPAGARAAFVPVPAASIAAGVRLARRRPSRAPPLR